METQTLEHNNIELLKEKGYVVSVIYFLPIFFHFFCVDIPLLQSILKQEELEVEKRKLLQEIKQLEGKRNNLKSAKPNLQDQQLLEQGKYVLSLHINAFLFFLLALSFYRKKLKLYKDLTKIQWDYEASRHAIKGCILFMKYSYT